MSAKKRKMEHPTKTTSRNAKFGFCSLTISAKKVATRAMATIFMISIANPSLTEIEIQI
ncbi:hypothetical protein [Peribacillus frigoritolerans]|uniref:hypothetical protein n=1 Tax=Peribacillus frigoritolerans TaxID=450367 RepID=UPI00227DA717|nr:hypothetical protein [Peribacillus frigoritolerans]MCY9141279.1 hypothetical protein [Peribacillus frigoritolerans]